MLTSYASNESLFLQLPPKNRLKPAYSPRQESRHCGKTANRRVNDPA